MYFHLGGNMKADRYNEYPENFDRANKKTSMFINLNHEFATLSSVRAFEAYVTYLGGSTQGCMHWLVSVIITDIQNKYSIFNDL